MPRANSVNTGEWSAHTRTYLGTQRVVASLSHLHIVTLCSPGAGERKLPVYATPWNCQQRSTINIVILRNALVNCLLIAADSSGDKWCACILVRWCTDKDSCLAMPVVPLLEEEDDDNDDGGDDDNIADSDVDYYDEGSDNYDDASCSTLGNSRVQGDLI